MNCNINSHPINSFYKIYCLYIIRIIILFGNLTFAQNYTLSNSFTTENGLPSNHIYEITEDKNGFLWIATDNGISRFDGKRFVNYSTKNGLPSNDVLQIKLETDGTIWVNCYKQPPSYFDEKNNRFISFEESETIAKISNSLLYPSINPTGGIYFSNIYGSMFFKDRKMNRIIKKRFYTFSLNEKCYFINMKSDKLFDHYLFYTAKNKYVGELKCKIDNPMFNLSVVEDNIFQLYKKKIKAYKITSVFPLKYQEQTVSFNENLKWFSFSKEELAIITTTGKVIVYNKNTFKKITTITSTSDINYYYKDINNSVWIATLNNGLLKYNVSAIKNINPKENMSTNFLSIRVNHKNAVFAGNYDGQTVEIKKTIKTHNHNTTKNTIWIRTIDFFKDTIVTVSDLGYSINYGSYNLIHKNAQINISLKTATKLNDSILIIGSNSGFYKLNILKNTYTYLGFQKERILSISKINDHEFYYTANSGVYKFDTRTKVTTLFFANINLKNDNIHTVITSTNGSAWFTTFKGNLYLVKNKKVLFSIVNSDKIPINITRLLEIKNELWIASKDGIYILNTSKLPYYNVMRISKSDGLTSNFINDFTYKNDSVYVATNNGISILPVNISSKNDDIKPIIISAKINNKIVQIQSNYSLSSTKKNIILELAGVNLSGHFKKFEYRINDEREWFEIEGNILNVLLKGGGNNIEIRAIDQNNFIGKETIKIKIDVAVPIQDQPLFWIIIVILFAGLVFIYLFTRKLDHHKASFQKQLELEQQRNKMTADLHDDIGATLSSLQINSAVANELLLENPKEAKKILTKIESQAQNISHIIGDIIWSTKPGKEEFISLSMRIKNFVNEILGATNIKYEIVIDEEINTILTDITIRKNIILITKEAVNNAVKYSMASEIFLALRRDANYITLEIRDNGCGFDNSVVPGNGLGNIKRRTEEMNGILSLQSEIKNGTLIKVEIPFVT